MKFQLVIVMLHNLCNAQTYSYVTAKRPGYCSVTADVLISLITKILLHHSPKVIPPLASFVKMDIVLARRHK